MLICLQLARQSDDEQMTEWLLEVDVCDVLIWLLAQSDWINRMLLITLLLKQRVLQNNTKRGQRYEWFSVRYVYFHIRSYFSVVIITVPSVDLCLACKFINMYTSAFTIQKVSAKPTAYITHLFVSWPVYAGALFSYHCTMYDQACSCGHDHVL